MLSLACAIAGLSLPLRPSVAPSPSRSVTMVDPWATTGGGGIDGSTVLGVAVGLAGVLGGVGIIAFTESAGKRNEELANAQPCVECKGKKVVECTICEGSGEDPLVSLVQGVREASGEIKASNVVKIEDWAEGPKEVVMFEDILSAYPKKVEKDVCLNCEGRGVVVCDNCRGTGIQPRFLERYSPDDFMD